VHPKRFRGVVKDVVEVAGIGDAVVKEQLLDSAEIRSVVGTVGLPDAVVGTDWVTPSPLAPGLKRLVSAQPHSLAERRWS
jgi:hypothetical protein